MFSFHRQLIISATLCCCSIVLSHCLIHCSIVMLRQIIGDAICRANAVVLSETHNLHAKQANQKNKAYRAYVDLKADLLLPVRSAVL